MPTAAQNVRPITVDSDCLESNLPNTPDDTVPAQEDPVIQEPPTNHDGYIEDIDLRVVEENLSHIDELEREIPLFVDTPAPDPVPRRREGEGVLRRTAADIWEEAEPFLTTAFQSLPGKEKTKLLDYLDAYVPKVRSQFEEKSCIVPPLPEPDTTGKTYALYRKRTDALEHLEKVWGPWLKHYTPELDRNYLFQDQLRKRDPKLVTALNYKVKKLQKQLSEIVPPKTARIDLELETFSHLDLKTADRLRVARLRRDQSRSPEPR